MAVKCFGIEGPIIREGDNLVKIVTDSVLENEEVKTRGLNDLDIIGITESVVARAAGLYATIDEIAEDIKKKLNNPEVIYVANPIYSRNRFSMILKAIARAAKLQVVILMPFEDEVGNPRGVNPFTGVNIEEYYTNIVKSEGKFCTINGESFDLNNQFRYRQFPVIYCGLHDYGDFQNRYPNWITLADICNDKNPDFGLLGTNKATEEKLKLFPTKKIATDLCLSVQEAIRIKTGKKVLVCVYGDGCFHDPVAGIWEFADPVTMPGYSNPEVFESTPNEIKIKAFADDKFKDLSGAELQIAIKEEIKNKEKNLVGNMNAMGTTPRLFRDIIASFMDLCSGSGDKGTPFILLQKYFENYAKV